MSMLKGIGKGLDHKRTKVKQLVGAVEKTNDNEFEASRAKLDNVIKTVNVLMREIQKLDQEISNYLTPLKSISTDLNQFCALDSYLMECSGNFENAVFITDSTITNYSKVQGEVQAFAKTVLEGLQILKRKVALRDEALLDYDKYRTKLKTAKEQNNTVHTEKYTRKLSNFQQQYETINQELKIQIDEESVRVNGYFVSEIQKMYRRHYSMFYTLGEGFKAIADNEIVAQVDSNTYNVSKFVTSYTGSESVSAPKPSSPGTGASIGGVLKSVKRKSMAFLSTPFGNSKEKSSSSSSTTTTTTAASNLPPPKPKESPFNERPPGIPPPVQNTYEDENTDSQQYDSSQQYPVQTNPFEDTSTDQNYSYPAENNPYNDPDNQNNPFEQNYAIDENGNYYYPENQQQT